MEDILGLQVSATKSGVLASKPAIADTITKASCTTRVASLRQAKALGTPAGGGKKRAAKSLYRRVSVWTRKLKRVQALRRAGVNTVLMAMTAGTPSITYGVDTVGMGDTHLERARSAIARASAPDGGGKDPNLVLRLLDGTGGTADPAFDAHVKPIVAWATAWWEAWQPQALLRDAAKMAVGKIHR